MQPVSQSVGRGREYRCWHLSPSPATSEQPLASLRLPSPPLTSHTPSSMVAAFNCAFVCLCGWVCFSCFFLFVRKTESKRKLNTRGEGVQRRHPPQPVAVQCLSEGDIDSDQAFRQPHLVILINISLPGQHFPLAL